MKWKTHKILGGVFYFACSGKAVESICVGLSSILPDIVGPYKDHRNRLSHDAGLWFMLYIVATAVSHYGKIHSLTQLNDPTLLFTKTIFAVAYILKLMFAGALSHLVMGDMFTKSGIRFFGVKVVVPVSTTGKLSEMVTASLLLLCAGAIWYFHFAYPSVPKPLVAFLENEDYVFCTVCSFFLIFGILTGSLLGKS